MNKYWPVGIRELWLIVVAESNVSWTSPQHVHNFSFNVWTVTSSTCFTLSTRFIGTALCLYRASTLTWHDRLNPSSFLMPKFKATHNISPFRFILILIALSAQYLNIVQTIVHFRGSVSCEYGLVAYRIFRFTAPYNFGLIPWCPSISGTARHWNPARRGCILYASEKIH